MIIVNPDPTFTQYSPAGRVTGNLRIGRAQPSYLNDDPSWNERGEAGYYYDTQLGGPRRRGLFSALRAKLGLGDAEPATTDDVVSMMNAHNDRVFALTVVSTTAVAVSALLTVFRTLKLIREDARG